MTKNSDQELSDAELDLAVGGSGTTSREATVSPTALVETSPAPAAGYETLQLQMAMDERSRLVSTLSNILKKASEAQSGIINNMK